MAFKITHRRRRAALATAVGGAGNSPLPLEVREVRMNPLETRGGRGEQGLGRNRQGHDPNRPEERAA